MGSKENIYAKTIELLKLSMGNTANYSKAFCYMYIKDHVTLRLRVSMGAMGATL